MEIEYEILYDKAYLWSKVQNESKKSANPHPCTWSKNRGIIPA